ncbi:MAG: glycosyltransferase family 39 protein [Lewinellaceae bacterium]|nr:glycosyltransferase family 39 protein [Lewinellaceae bacterium]
MPNGDYLEQLANMRIRIGAIFFLLIIWLLASVLVGPIGDFPLNDDWHFAFPVKSLLEKGTYELAAELPPNIFLHVGLGYLACKLAGGFSFTALRLYTILFGFFSSVLLFAIIRSNSQKNSFWISMGLLFNPVFFVLSFSFMTDVPFLFFALLSILFYLLFLEKQNWIFRYLGLLAGLGAFLVRQPGLLIPLSFELAFFLTNEKHRKNTLWLFTVLCFLLLFYFSVENILKSALGLREYYIPVGSIYISSIFERPAWFLFRIAKYSIMSVFYLGFFFLPFISSVFRTFFKEFSPSWLWAGGGLALNILLIIILGSHGYFFPYGGNILYNLGLGPLLLRDVWVLGMHPLPRIPFLIITFIGMVSQVNGCFLFLLFCQNLFMAWKRKNELLIFSGLLFILYMPLMMVFSFFDRYLLLPFCIILIFFFFERKSWKPNLAYYGVLAAFIYFSIAATRDYLSWNRVTEYFYQELIQEGVPVTDIDGGFANNGFNTKKNRNPNANFVITFSRLQGYSVIKEENYYSWLYFRKVSLALQKKE